MRNENKHRYLSSLTSSRELIILMIFLMSGITHAQTPLPVCGSGLPCGNIPWRLPEFPPLESPTPLDLSDQYADPEDPTETPTPTFTPSPTPELGIGGFVDSAGNYIDGGGTPTPDFGVDSETEYANITGDSVLFFSYAKAVLTSDFGVLSPLLVFLLTIILLTLLIKSITLILPMLTALVGFIRKIIELIPGM